jgi:hypothetical protein
MLHFVQDSKIWFYLWTVTPTSFELTSLQKYPLEYGDARFNNALPRLLSGSCVAVEVGKTPLRHKALKIDLALAQKMYSDGLPTLPEPFQVDWYRLFEKVDKKTKSELQLKAQMQNDIAIISKKMEIYQDAALQKALQLHRENKRVPTFMKAILHEYLRNQERTKSDV